MGWLLLLLVGALALGVASLLLQMHLETLDMEREYGERI